MDQSSFAAAIQTVHNLVFAKEYSLAKFIAEGCSFAIFAVEGCSFVDFFEKEHNLTELAVGVH